MNILHGSDQPNKSPEQLTTEKVAALNDQLRTTGQGGQIMATQGIQSLPRETQTVITNEIRNVSDFPAENDPYGEHDFGAVTVQGTKVFWKIDYYDQSMTMHSPDKSDPNVTNRVMNIMLASEY